MKITDLKCAVIGPDPEDIDGLAELKWVMEYIAFEYPIAKPTWWYDIIEGLPDPIVKNGLIEVWDTPGLGVDFKVDQARQYLAPEDQDFFD